MEDEQKKEQFALFGKDLFGEPVKPNFNALATRFGVPPFSYLDVRQGYWLERKRAWMSIGLRSEKGRKDGLAFTFAEGSALEEFLKYPTTSVFDPVLSECAYRWWAPSAENLNRRPTILDPFCGGSVRGVVASLLGYEYHGFDLRQEQVDANYQQWRDIGQSGVQPNWYVGDSKDIDKNLRNLRVELRASERFDGTPLKPPEKFDFIFSCPPYYDLEKYCDDPDDLSNMSWDDFCVTYRQVIAKSCELLADNRFACFVVGPVRDKRGMHRGFVNETIDAFTSAGLGFYNDAVIITQAGSAPMRATKQFQAGRKLCRSHQNVLVFYKGDHRKIKDVFGKVKMGY